MGYNIARALQSKRSTYKIEPDLLQLRDQTAISLLAESGLRVSEARKLRKKQFNYSDPNYVMIKDAETSKRGTIRDEIPLPLKGVLSPFTEIVTAWLNHVPNPENYFIPTARYSLPSASGTKKCIEWDTPLSRQRLHVIIKAITGKYPHYLRAICETHYGRIFRNNWALKDFMGLTDMRSTEPYVKTDWRDYSDRMLE